MIFFKFNILILLLILFHLSVNLFSLIFIIFEAFFVQFLAIKTPKFQAKN